MQSGITQKQLTAHQRVFTHAAVKETVTGLTPLWRVTDMAEMKGLILRLLLFSGKFLLTNSKVLLPDLNVTCIIQDDCVLPCSYRPTGTVVIHWYKQQIPVHSYYYHKDQFGLQNKHFSGRTSLFNSHIPQGNASLLLRRVKVQDKGRYKCYTSTRKGNQEMFVNLELKAPIQSVTMEMSDDKVTCTSHNIYPMPQVMWATEPASAQEALENSTIRTADHKGLFTVESTLRIVGNLSDRTYFCSFMSADRNQVWTASQKNQENITHEEGHPLSISCMAPHSLENFSLTWTISSLVEQTLILKYDNRTGHMVNLWEGQAVLDQDQLLQGDGSLLLSRPDSMEHSGTYTCAFSSLQSRHIVQTKVNITVALISVDKKSQQRSWWSTAASAAFVLFTIIVALPRCARQRALEARKVSHTLNGAGLVEDGLRLCKDLNSSTSCKVEQPGAGCNRQSAHFEVHEEQSDVHRAGSFNGTPGTDSDHENEKNPQESPAEENEVPQSECFENNDIKKHWA
uniref:HERV-H LTR-associating 2a, tandem duplicate 2 n=1 Tax=Xiphophorus maculatus TaxID=8083 RepID=A0A3B5R4Z5_XIPMA